MIMWEVDDFPIVRDFCKEYNIEFVIYNLDELINIKPRIKFMFRHNDNYLTLVYFDDEFTSASGPYFEKMIIRRIKEAKLDRQEVEQCLMNKELHNAIHRSTYNPTYNHPRNIKKVIFHDPATIVYWIDGTKTVVKAENEPFDPEKGLAMAIAKKYFGNNGNYYDIFRKWLPKVEEKKEPQVVGHATIEELVDGLLIKARAASTEAEKWFAESVRRFGDIANVKTEVFFDDTKEAEH